MVNSISSRHFFTLVIIIVFVALPSSDGADNWFKACSTLLFSCGDIKDVGYPFWGDGRPRYCGDPAMQLQCISSLNGSYPSLKIDSKDLTPYNVLNLTISDRGAALRLRGAPKTDCAYYGKDVGEILQFDESVEMVNVLYSCGKAIIVQNQSDGNVTCYQNKTSTPVYYRHNESALGKYASCNSAEVPVSREELARYAKDELSFHDVLRQGFEVNFEYSLSCIKCRKSGCLCGSSRSSDFLCLCTPGKWKLILGIAISVGVTILAALCVCLCCYKILKSRSPVLFSRGIPIDLMTSDLEVDGSVHGVHVFPYSELQEATDNFNVTQELGDGGFGIVYYGKLRDGREVAVKRLYEKSYRQIGQFMNEVEILTRLRHPNLVTLYGCTSSQSSDLVLVYEYMSNGTVADHLYGDLSGSKALTWAIRMKIAIETASALSYLHTSDIVHRDVKATNILLDKNFSVKVADFGLSRLCPTNMTHVSTSPQGTPGYLDPEYHKCYQVTNKSDVYSFGVVLVELISSLPAVDICRNEIEINLSDYAMNRIQRGLVDELVDKKLGYNSDFKVKRMITLVAELAFQCLQQKKEVRPFMTEILDNLVHIEMLDYEALQANEMKGTRTSVTMDDETELPPPPSPSSVIDNCAVMSNTSSRSC